MKHIDKSSFVKDIGVSFPMMYSQPSIWYDIQENIFPLSLRMLTDGSNKIELTSFSY